MSSKSIATFAIGGVLGASLFPASVDSVDSAASADSAPSADS